MPGWFLSLIHISSISYTEEDGLVNREGNGGSQPAGIKALDGTLWFPGQGGVATVNPANIARNSIAPPIQIQRIDLENGSIVPVSYTHLYISQRRKAKSLFKWLARITGIDACWIEGTDEHNHPVWGLIKRIIGNRFLVKSTRFAAASIIGASLCVLNPPVKAQGSVDASTFRGQNGFTITGLNYADHLGADLAMGDINGDGFEDLIMGAFGVGPGNSNKSPGQTAVVFGSTSGFDSSLSLSSL